MKKQIITAISTHPIRAAFLLILPFLLGPPMHQALGQGNTGKQRVTASMKMPQVAPSSTGAITGTYAVPANKPAPNIPTLSGGAATAEPAGGGCTPGPWTQAAPVAVDHYGGFMDSDGTFAYEGGGYSFSVGDNTNQFGKFNPATNTWTPLAPVPDLFNAEASGVYAPNVNKLFVFGGDSPNSGTVVNTTRIYNIATNTWSTGAPMPDVRAFMASGYFNGKIYLVGGYNTGNVDPSFGQVWEYDPVLNTFNTSRMSMPATLGGPGFGIINGHIYVAGGRNLNNTNLNTLYDYDIAADSWTARANMPTGVNVPGSAVIGGKLWVFGGGNPFVGSEASPKSNKQGVLTPDTTNILQIYDPATDSWSSGPTLNQQRSFPAGTHVGNTAVAVGGYTGSSTTTSVEISICGGGGGCQFRVLIAYSDVGGPPTTLQSQILAEPGVIAVDLFDASSGTPTLTQLEQYNIVVAFSNNPYSNAVAMGNVLADYADTGGVVVGLNFDWFGPPFDLEGRWQTGGYSPFVDGGPTNFVNSCLGTYDTTHPLMQGISAGSLCAFFRHTLALSSGAVSVALYQDSQQLCAYKTNNGHTGVGINAYLGENPMNFSGLFGRVIVNAGRWLSGSCGAPMAQSAFSRKVHGGAGTFDIPLPLTGNVGVECRIGPTYQMIINFATSVTVQSASVTSGTGMVSSFSGSGTSQITVNLSGVTDQQRITMTLHGVNNGTTTGDVPISMGVLIGDVNGNASVNSTDVAQTKSKVGQTLDSTNFREDVNANGVINAIDVSQVKSEVGHSLPP